MVWIAHKGKRRWLKPREHLTTAFKREAIEDLMLELKERELMGATYYLGEGNADSTVVRINQGKRWARIYVRRKREELLWGMHYAYHHSRVNDIERRSVELLWPYVKNWLDHGRLHVYRKHT